MNAIKLITFFLITVLTLTPVHANDIPETIHYQGILTTNDGNPVENGIYTFSVRIYDAESSSEALWAETQQAEVINGIFNIHLGIAEPLDLDFDSGYWIGISVNGGEELAPRMPLHPVAYAIHAKSVPHGSITTEKLAEASVTQGKLHPDITLPLSGEAGGDLTGDFPDPVISDGAVTVSKLADGAITTDKLADEAVTQDKIHPGVSLPVSGNAGGVLTGSYPDPELADEAVTTAKLANSTVTSVKLANNAVTTAKIQNGAVTADKIANSAVTAGIIANSSVTTDKLTDGAVTSDKIASGGVTSAKLASNINITTTGTVEAGSFVGDGSQLTNINAGVIGLPFSGETSTTGSALHIRNTGTGIAIRGEGDASSGSTTGIFGRSLSTSGTGLWGLAVPLSGITYGVRGISNSTSGRGVYGQAGATSGSTYGVYGLSTSPTGRGVYGEATSTSGANNGVLGVSASSSGRGVYGYATASSGVNFGVIGQTNSSSGYAGYFLGRVHVAGTLSKAGGSFEIDHPLDPENMVLRHSFVESPDMMNVYNGNANLDIGGEAWIELPGWFEALNMDYRYQLTAIGMPGPDLHIAEGIDNNRFKIAGGQAGMKVSWQVTGIRKDPWAEGNRVVVEESKSPELRGFYLHPGVYGQPESRSAAWARDPDGMKYLEERLKQMELQQFVEEPGTDLE